MTLCDRDCSEPAVAFIPMPAGEKRADIHVCEAHFQDAIELCYFVQRYDETLSFAETRNERFINRKHERILVREGLVI